MPSPHRFTLAVAVGLLVPALSLGCGRADETSVDDPSAGSGNRTVATGPLVHEPGAFAGYTLIAPYLSTTTYLIDMEGDRID